MEACSLLNGNGGTVDLENKGRQGGRLEGEEGREDVVEMNCMREKRRKKKKTIGGAVHSQNILLVFLSKLTLVNLFVYV